MAEEIKTPKVFISYSWKPEEDKNFVKEIADRLISESGINVMIDIYDLSPGDDKFAYMERMVTDDSINKVLIFSNSVYSEKANKREGGVGTESTIISQEVYNKVTQNKFIPILLEKDEKGNPILPAFIKSRIYIDFSDLNRREDEYERLVRFVYNKPLDKKPSLGSIPKYILEDDPVKLNVHYKLERFKNALIEGKKNIPILIEDYLESFIEDLTKLKVEDNTENVPFDEKVYRMIESTKLLRDNFLNFFELLIKLDEDEIKEILHKHIESWSELISLDNNTDKNIKRCSQHYRFLFKELFMYMITIAMLKEKFGLISHLLNKPYWINVDGNEYKNYNFTFFESYISFLDKARNERLKKNQKSISTNLLVERIDFKKLNLRNLQETDQLLYFMSLLKYPKLWFPYLTMYGVNRLSFMIRAESKIFFDKIKIIFEIDKIDELKEKIVKIPQNLRNLYYPDYDLVDIEYGLNINNLAAK